MPEEAKPGFPVVPSDHSWNLARSLGIRRKDALEDFLTDSLAGAMDEDRDLARRLLSLFCPTALHDNNDSENSKIEIATQVGYGGSTVDLVLNTIRMRVGVEIKLRSPETPGQLAKYLEIDQLDSLAFLAPDIRNVAAEVYQHPKYCRPSTGHRHFLWSDLYPLVMNATTEASANSLTRRGLLGLFQHLNLTPIQSERVAPSTGKAMRAPSKSGEKTTPEQKEIWGKLLRKTRSDIQRMGWGLDHAQPGEIWTEVRRRRLAQVWIDCVNRPGYFRVNLRFPESEYRSMVANAFAEPLPDMPAVTYELVEGVSKGKENHTRYTLFVVTPNTSLLKDHTGPVDISARLSRFATSVIKRAEEALQ